MTTVIITCVNSYFVSYCLLHSKKVDYVLMKEGFGFICLTMKKGCFPFISYPVCKNKHILLVICTSFLGSCFILYSLSYIGLSNDNYLFIIHNNDYLGYFKNFSIVLMLTIPIIFTLIGLIV